MSKAYPGHAKVASHMSGSNTRLRDWLSVELVAAAAVMALVAAKWHSVYFAYREPPAWIVVVGIVSCLALLRRIPSIAWAWWAAGALTLVWSVAPGNTFVATLWELGYLAAFAAGFWRRGFWIFAVVLLMFGLERTLLLSAFGLTQFMSGSTHYVAGAQALVLVPLSFSSVVRPGNRWTRIVYAVLLFASLFLAMSSGARAVYLPLALLLAALVARHLMEKRRPILVFGTLAWLAVGIAGVDAAIPQHPVALALGRGATVEAQLRSSTEYGGFAQRVRFWDQTFDIALAHPLGAGTGSYQAIIHTYQKYPMVWSASPHNYYVETVATGGWLRLGLLLVMLIQPILRAWRGRQWPWALATLGIWATLAFDVTSYYPVFMMFGFATLGATWHATMQREGILEAAKPSTRLSGMLRVAVAVVCLCFATGMAAWWFLPCHATSCVTQRYLGIEAKALPELRTLGPIEQEDLLSELRQLYPESVWVLRAEQSYSQTPHETLVIAREIATRFPYQHPDNYLSWANAALDLGDFDEARTAIDRGLEVFPENQYPYGDARMTRERYQTWLDDANAILERVGSRP